MRDSSAAAAGAVLAGQILGAGKAVGATLPSNPISIENQAAGSTGFELSPTLATTIVEGFTKRPSVNVGEAVELVVGGYSYVDSAAIEVYRLGYYGGAGARLVYGPTAQVSVDQSTNHGSPYTLPADKPGTPSDYATYGVVGRANQKVTITIPAGALTVSGVYLVKVLGKYSNGTLLDSQSHIPVIVRDDSRTSDALVVVPTNTWQAYNRRGGGAGGSDDAKSLYDYQSSSAIVSTTNSTRASKVSLDRPFGNWVNEINWVLKAEFPLYYWLEQQGYDVRYTEDVHFGFNAGQALKPQTKKAVIIPGHSEYWSLGMRNGCEAARDAGVSILNFGANTAYWRVRHETVAGAPATNADEARVLVCYKTIQGGQYTTGHENDPGTVDPVEPTTTWRDPGHGLGTPGAGTGTFPASGYVGNSRPESGLLGVQYIGDDDYRSQGLTVPGAAGDEFAGHPAWRYTSIAGKGSSTRLGTRLLGWEWDGAPNDRQPFTAQPPGAVVKRMSATRPTDAPPSPTDVAYLIDAGRLEGSPRGANAAPPAGWGDSAHAVTYTAPSGARVFSAGTIQWAFGLGPFYDGGDQIAAPGPPNGPAAPYPGIARDATEIRPEIQQASANIMSDAGLIPATPVSTLKFDPGFLPSNTPVSPPPPATPAPPPGGQPQPVVKVKLYPNVKTISKKGTIDFSLSLPAGIIGEVRATVKLTSAKKLLAQKTVKLNPGILTVINLPLTKSTKAKLASKGKLRATADVRTTDFRGAHTEFATPVTLKARKPGK